MEPETSRLVRLGELLKKPLEDVQFLVEGLLIKAGLGLLAGKPKAGKSTLARGLGFAVARGEPFLDLPCEKGSVLYYGLEEKESEVQRHFLDMGADGTEPIVISTHPLPGIEALTNDIEKCKPSLVIIDPLFRAVRVRESNAYAEVTNALAPYLYLARQMKVHILFVHHLGKGDRKGADAILGSTAIRGAFDVNILLNRTEHHRTIQSENRYGTDLEETILNFDSETRIVSLGEKRQIVDAERTGQYKISKHCFFDPPSLSRILGFVERQVEVRVS